MGFYKNKKDNHDNQVKNLYWTIIRNQNDWQNSYGIVEVGLFPQKQDWKTLEPIMVETYNFPPEMYSKVFKKDGINAKEFYLYIGTLPDYQDKVDDL